MKIKKRKVIKKFTPLKGLNFYYLDLPEKTTSVYLDIYLKTGYTNENNNEFGRGHLLEHYLIKKINNLEVNASIEPETTVYSLISNSFKSIRDIKKFSQFVLKPDFSDNKLLISEKEALLDELLIKSSPVFHKAREKFLKERVGRNCRYTRAIENHIMTIKRTELKDLKRYHRKFFTISNIVIILSGYRLKSSSVKKIASLFRNYNLSTKQIKNIPPRCQYSELKIKLIENKNYKKGVVLGLTFPSFDLKTDDFSKIAIFILDHFLKHPEEELMLQVRKLGIYNLEYERITWRRMGIIILSTLTSQRKILPLLKLLKKGLLKLKNKLIEENKLYPLLKKFKNSELRAFNNNKERKKWMSYDLINYGRPILPFEDFQILNKITPLSIQEIAQSIFQKKKMNLFIIGNKINKFKKTEIIKLMEF